MKETALEDNDFTSYLFCSEGVFISLNLSEEELKWILKVAMPAVAFLEIENG